MIKATAVDNKAISSGGDNEAGFVEIVKNTCKGDVGGGNSSDYYYKNFYVRNPNEIKICENNGKLTSKSLEPETVSKEEFTLVSNKLYKSSGHETPARFRTVATVQPPSFVQIDEHRPASYTEFTTRVLSTSSSSPASSNFSQLSLSSSSLSSLSSSSSTASTSSSSASASSATSTFIPAPGHTTTTTSSSLYVKRAKPVVTIKQKQQPRMAYVAPLHDLAAAKQPTGEPKLKVIQKPSGYNEIYNNYVEDSDSPSGTFDRQHQNRQSIITIKRPGQSFAKITPEETKPANILPESKSEHDNQLTELISSGGVKNLRQKFLENVSKANSVTATNLSESDLLKIKSEDELNESGSERESKPARKMGGAHALKNFELKKCKSAMVMNEPAVDQASTSDSVEPPSDEAENVKIVSMGQRMLAHPSSHDPMKYGLGGSCDNLDFEPSTSTSNLTSTDESDARRPSSDSNCVSDARGLKANSLKIRVSNRPSIRKMQKFKSDLDISRKMDMEDYPRGLNDDKLEVVNFGEILDSPPPSEHRPSIEQFFDYKKFENNYNTIKQAFDDLKNDNEFLKELLGQMTNKVKEASAEVAQIINGPESLTDSFDYETIAENPRPESVSFIRVKTDQSGDKLRVNSDFVRLKSETLKAMPPVPRLPRHSDQTRSNKPVAVILAMEKKRDQINETINNDHENFKLNKPNSTALTLIRHKF